MAAVSSHIKQWTHNRAFLLTIPLEYPDWLVTVSFYVALHAVDALLAYDKISPTSHAYHNAVALKTNRYAEIRRGYMPLYNLCRAARYLADPDQWIPSSKIQAQVIESYLRPIENSVEKLIKQELSLPPILITPK
jgi:hypothetical protein